MLHCGLMNSKRRKHTAKFKARVAFEAIQGLKTQSEVAKEFEVHPVMLGKWKAELLERKVGQLTMAVDFLEKSASSWGFL